MSQSSTLFIEMEIHADAIAVAYVAQDHGEVTHFGTIGTRRCDINQLSRKMQSRATSQAPPGPRGHARHRYSLEFLTLKSSHTLSEPGVTSVQSIRSQG